MSRRRKPWNKKTLTALCQANALKPEAPPGYQFGDGDGWMTDCCEALYGPYRIPYFDSWCDYCMGELPRNYRRWKIKVWVPKRR